MAQEMVTLITKDIFTPYRADEVFTVTKEEADAILAAAPQKVRLFDASADADALNEALPEKLQKRPQAAQQAPTNTPPAGNGNGQG